MTRETIEAVADAGADKASLARQSPWRFLCRAGIAGFFIVVGTLFSIFCGGWFFAQNLAVARLLAAVSFSCALILIVLLGGELFTGASLVMSVSLYEKRVRFSELLRVWGLCYLGNFLGIALLCALVSASGAITQQFSDYIMLGLPGKLNCPWYGLVFKGVLCNFLVCIGVFSGIRLKSEVGKALVITCVISCFVLAGLEHSIANMATFCLASMLRLSADYGAMALNLLCVTVGNILGGAILLGLPLWLSAEKKQS